jgi:hypothetical protein
MKITSRRRLHESVYRELRMRYIDYPSALYLYRHNYGFGDIQIV